MRQEMREFRVAIEARIVHVMVEKVEAAVKIALSVVA